MKEPIDFLALLEENVKASAALTKSIDVLTKALRAQTAVIDELIDAISDETVDDEGFSTLDGR